MELSSYIMGPGFGTHIVGPVHPHHRRVGPDVALEVGIRPLSDIVQVQVVACFQHQAWTDCKRGEMGTLQQETRYIQG